MLCISSAVQQLCVVCSGPGEWVATLNMCNPHKESVSGRSGPGNSYLSQQPHSYSTSQWWAASKHVYFARECSHALAPVSSLIFFAGMLLFMLILTNIKTLLLRLPNGWCGTEWWQPGWHKYLLWNTTASQFPRSRLLDYLSLNKLHYGSYYPGIHSQVKKKNNPKQNKNKNSTFQSCCSHDPRAPCMMWKKEELSNRGRSCKRRGGRFSLATFVSPHCRNNLDWDINQFVPSLQN